MGLQLAPTKNKIHTLPFLSYSHQLPRNKNTDKRQATNNQWMLPVGYLTNLWYFQLSNHHKSHIGMSLKTKIKTIFLCLICDCSYLPTNHQLQGKGHHKPCHHFSNQICFWYWVWHLLNTLLTIHIRFSLILIPKNSSSILVLQCICGLSRRISFLITFSPTMNKKEIRFLV